MLPKNEVLDLRGPPLSYFMALWQETSNQEEIYIYIYSRIKFKYNSFNIQDLISLNTPRYNIPEINFINLNETS